MVYGPDQTETDDATRGWLERQTLCALTGWAWREVQSLSQHEVRLALIFRDEWNKASKK